MTKFEISNSDRKVRFGNLASPKPITPRSLVQPSDPVPSDGNDNINGDLIIYFNEKIETYTVTRLIGSGSFGHVFRANCDGKSFALKINSSNETSTRQLIYESDALKHLKEELPEEAFNYLPIFVDFIFNYKNHSILVTDLLGHSILSILQQRKWIGFPLDLVQSILFDVLNALKYVHSLNLIHCDIKIENILLKNNIHVKLIDFGSCSAIGTEWQSPLQTLFYRAPEVVLRFPITTAIDIWSVGCLAAELFLGLPLFCARSEPNLIYLVSQLFGDFPFEIIKKSRVFDVYFTSEGKVRPVIELESIEKEDFSQYPKYFKHAKLRLHISGVGLPPCACDADRKREMQNRETFCDLLELFLQLDPQKRLSAVDALNHPFFSIKFS